MVWALVADVVPLYPLYALLFADAGLSDADVSALLALWSVTVVLAEVPSGALADRFSRRAVVPVGCLVTVAGVLLTLPDLLPLVVLGLAAMTAGFFGAHGVASGWVPTRAHAGGVAAGQAASLYLFAYYLGSSVFGSITGRAWTVGGWPAVVALATGLLVVSALLALWLRNTPSLDPLRR